MYRIQSSASCTLPEPTFTDTNGFAPIWPRKSMNSWVPTVLGSVTPPQCVLILTGRLARGPIPSRQ